MADDNVKIRAELDASQARAEAERLKEAVGGSVADGASQASEAVSQMGDGVATSLDKAADSAGRLEGRLKDVSRETKISTQQIVSLASHLASIGVQAYAALNPDAPKAATGAAAMALQGMGAGAMFGPWGAAIGAAGGAAVGWWSGKAQDDRAAEDAEAQRAAVRGNSRQALANMEWELEKAEYLKNVFKTLDDTSKSVADREKQRGQAVAAIEDAQTRLMAWMQSGDVQEDPRMMAQYLTTYGKNATLLDRLKEARVSEETRESAVGEHKTEAFAKRAQLETDALQKLGINVGGGDGRAVESIERTVGQIKSTMEAIARNTSNGGTPVWQ